jgi:transposase InsO family protein
MKHSIDLIANGKVYKGTTLTAIRERSLPYLIDRGVLMRRVLYRKEEITAVLVPFVFQEFLLKVFHNDPHSAHFGVRKMLARLSSRFYWLGMTQDCKRWVAACTECRSRKSVQDHRAGLPGVVPRAVQPGDFVGMDLVGPFTKSPWGNTYLLTMHCHFLRFPAAIPLRDASAQSLIDGFYYGWILEYGLPLAIPHDRGSNFTSSMFKRLVGVLGIEDLQTSAYHPECNGQEERPHRMINAALTAFVDSQGLNWDVVIKTILYAMRNSYHTSIDNTPFNVFMGRQAREPTDIIFGNVSVLLDMADNDMVTHPLRLRQIHDEVSQFSADLLRASYIKQAQGRHAVRFEPGDRVMLHTPFLPKCEDGKKVVSVPTRH